jgi:hypothetical protein
MTKKRDRNCLDKDTNKASPPSKMNRGGFGSNQGHGGGQSGRGSGGFNPNHNANHNANQPGRQFTLNDVMEKLDRIEGEIAGIWRKFEEVDNLKREVTDLRRMTEGFQRFEIEQKKKCILVRGLASRSTEKYETRQDTKQSLDEMFNYLGFAPSLEEYQRLGELKKDETENTLIRIKFTTIDEKRQLFEKFKEHGSVDELKKISLINDYPPFQLPEVKRLSQIAYDIRKNERGTKTRIVPRGLGIALQRRDGGGRWTNVSTNPIEH